MVFEKGESSRQLPSAEESNNVRILIPTNHSILSSFCHLLFAVDLSSQTNEAFTAHPLEMRQEY